MYRNHFRWLETADEYFDFGDIPDKGGGKYTGWNCLTPCSKRSIT
jgi:hypothetical protein